MNKQEPELAVSDFTSLASSSRYTGQLRWTKTGKLQQLVEVTTYRPVVEVDYQWKDVPTEDAQ